MKYPKICIIYDMGKRQKQQLILYILHFAWKRELNHRVVTMFNLSTAGDSYGFAVESNSNSNEIILLVIL